MYNEIDLVDRVFVRVKRFAEQNLTWEFLFVDDGSTDGTPERVAQLLALMDSPATLRLIPLQQNAGKGRAIHRGILESRGEKVCFTDGDLAYSLRQVELLVAALDDADVAVGTRSLSDQPQRNVRFRRRVLGAGFNRLVRLLTGLQSNDTQAGLKGFRHGVAMWFVEQQRVFDFAFDVELLFLAHRAKMRIKEVPAIVSLQHAYKDSSLKLLSDPLRMLWSVLQIRYHALRNHYELPDPAELRHRRVRHPNGVRDKDPTLQPTIHILSGAGSSALHAGSSEH